MKNRVSEGKGVIPAVIDDERLRDLWHCADLSIMDIAWALDAFHREVVARAKQLGLGARRVNRIGESDEEPTRAEIAERAAHIRMTRWTEEEREARLQRHESRWVAPTVPLTTFTGGRR